jgi:hypothetical protein
MCILDWAAFLRNTFNPILPPTVRFTEWSVLLACSQQNCAYKGRAVLVQAWTGLQVSRNVRLPDFKIIGT